MASPSHSRHLDDVADPDEEHNVEAASFYGEVANRDHEEHALDRHTSTTPPTNTPPPFSFDPAVYGALKREEIPDSQEDLDSEDILNSKDEFSWRFESDRTILIPGGTKITRKLRPKYVSLFSCLAARCSTYEFNGVCFYQLVLSKLASQHLSSLVRPVGLHPNHSFCLVGSTHKMNSPLVLNKSTHLTLLSSKSDTTTHIYHKPKTRLKGLTY